MVKDASKLFHPAKCQGLLSIKNLDHEKIVSRHLEPYLGAAVVVR